MRRRFLLPLLIAGILAGCASTAPTTSPVAGVEPLRVGIVPNYVPVIFKQGGVVSGIEADFALLMGEALGRPVELVELSWFELIPALNESRIDIIMSGMSVTPARREQVFFTDPYMQVGQMALIRTVDLGRISDSLSLYRTREKIGFEHGTTGEDFVRTRLERAQPVGFNSPDTGIAALRAGLITAFVHDAPTVWRIAGSPTERELVGLYQPLTEEYLAWAVRKNDVQLRDALNAQLSILRAKGELQRIIDRWITVRIEVR
ncbi:MAG: transporter substrate-binding domain-containing protein [Gammaproteobacteria bacterium]|nr:transporter substrate-binding domain-containing protein [Gammaproteobacteria bacterium]